MLPLYKLKELPRTLRLRKIIQIFKATESRLIPDSDQPFNPKKSSSPNINYPNADELSFFSDIANLLISDSLLSQETKDFFSGIAKLFLQSADSNKVDVPAVMRALNTARYILLTETGRSQADWDFTGSDGRLDPQKRLVFPGMFVYLEDIRSPFNVGAMFRTAESFGVERIFLSQFCADPQHARAQRTAMGCVDILPWQRFGSSLDSSCFSSCDSSLDSSCLFALETGGIPLAEFPFPKQGLLIVGCEELGVSPQALAAADNSLGRVSIPCYGAKGSLNVSVAFGIVMQAWAQACRC